MVDCNHSHFDLIELPHSEDGGQYLLGKGRCEECGSKLYLTYEPNDQRSDNGKFDQKEMDVEMRNSDQEAWVKFRQGSEIRNIIYELTGIDAVETF